jgi:drug/metabolite transporter (DMT)-like permease
MKNELKGILFIALAGACWSTIGVFAKVLLENDFTSYEIAFVRLFFGSLLLALYFLKRNPKLFKLDKKALIVTIVMGVVTQGLFNLVFFSSLNLIGVINATILLYLAPLFITIFSVVLFKERLNFKKRMGVLLSIIGSLLALTGGVFAFEGLSTLGIVFGILSGLGYSLVSIFGKFGIVKTPSETLIFYSFLFGLILISCFINPVSIIVKIDNLQVIGAILGLAVFPAVLAYIFYFKGISTGIELSKVGIMSMIELILSILWSVLFLNESLNTIKIIGLFLIFLAIYLINKPHETAKKHHPHTTFSKT